MSKPKLTEIVRSYSYKMSLPGYENRDFFCSRKEEVEPEFAEETSARLHKFCQEEVMKSVEQYKAENKPKKKPFVAKSDIDDEVAREMRLETEDENK